MKAVYIHGFTGSIFAPIVEKFRVYYPELEWCFIEVNQNPDESLPKIKQFLDENPDVEYLIGSSMGGFYVLCTEFAGRKIVINPLLQATKVLRYAVGTHQWRGKRTDGATEFTFTSEDAERFNHYTPKDSPQTVCHYTEHDQVLGEWTKEYYPTFFAHCKMVAELKGHFLSEEYIQHRLCDAMQIEL